MNTSYFKGMIGQRIREAREKYGLTQEELVSKLGRKSPGDISEYEQGKRKIYAEDLFDIATALEIPVLYFFQDIATTQEDMEGLLLNWFRSLPDIDSKRRLFVFLEQMKPLIIGEEKPTTYKPKRNG